jgi:DNA-directed RNA polymerase subunit H (RpoH/RPB5)
MGVTETVHRIMQDRNMTPVVKGPVFEEMKQYPMFFGLYEPLSSAQEAGDAVVFFFSQNLDVDSARAATALMDAHGIKNAMVISSCQVTSFGRKELQASSDHSIQFFTSDSLERELIDHSLIPKHELFLGELPKTFKEEQLGRLADTDFVVRWYNWKVGDIVKVTKVYGDLAPQINYFKVHSSKTFPVKKQDKGGKR